MFDRKQISRQHYFVADDSYKVYLNYDQMNRDYWFQYNAYRALEGNVVWLDFGINEWLTDNCEHSWRILTENYVVEKLAIIWDSYQEAYFEYLQPYIAFESIDDAILFKLSH